LRKVVKNVKIERRRAERRPRASRFERKADERGASRAEVGVLGTTDARWSENEEKDRKKRAFERTAFLIFLG
jgi:hypothetical protein